MRVPADRGIAGWVMQHGEAVVVDDVATDQRFYGQIDQSSGFKTRSMLAVPADDSRPADRRGRGDQQAWRGRVHAARSGDRHAFAAQAAVAIDNARLYRQLADAVVESRLSYRL